MTRTDEAFRLLCHANPVPNGSPEVADRAMRLRRLIPVAQLQFLHAGSRSHARHWQRRGVVLALATLVTLALVASAFGVRVAIRNFLSEAPAPPKVIEQFDRLASGAPAGMDPMVIPGETRKILTAKIDGSDRTLWVAPTRAGGFCSMWSGLGGGCDRLGTQPLQLSWGPRGPVGSERSSAFILGAADSDYVASVEIRLADGETIEPEITWISSPIRAGFFTFEPSADGDAGHAIEVVTALDVNHQVVTRQFADPAKHVDEIPADAIIAARRPAAQLDADGRKVTIWTAPTRYRGRCAWIQPDEQTRSLGCAAKGYESDGIALGYLATPSAVVIAGPLTRDVSTARFEYPDGSTKESKIGEGFLLYLVPRGDIANDQAPTSVAFYNAHGSVITRMTINLAAVPPAPSG
jgi:hypothetical protein